MTAASDVCKLSPNSNVCSSSVLAMTGARRSSSGATPSRALPWRRMLHDAVGKPFRCAHKEVTAAHRGVNEVELEHGEGEGIVAAFFLGCGGECALDIVGGVEAIESGRKSFTNQELNDPVGRV